MHYSLRLNTKKFGPNSLDQLWNCLWSIRPLITARLAEDEDLVAGRLQNNQSFHWTVDVLFPTCQQVLCKIH